MIPYIIIILMLKRLLDFDSCIFQGDENDNGCSSDHRCVKCDRRFMTASALLSHDKFCSLLQMRPDIPPESPLNPRLRSETPEKKIAIQIRKDYKKTMAQSGSGAAGWGDEDKSQSAPFRVPHVPKELQFLKDPQSPKETQNAKETPPSKESRDSKGQQQELPQTTVESLEQKEPQADDETLEKKEPESTTGASNQSKIENLLAQFCNMSHLSCIPCEKRYQSITTLKRHASQHFDWTRFACKVCKYRSYHRYEAMRHCITEHQVNEDHVAKMIKEDEYIGPLKYYITPPAVPRTQSPSGLSVSETSEKSNDNSSSTDTRNSKENNDQFVKSEKEDDQVPKKPEKKDTECTDDERTEKFVKVKEETEIVQSLKVNESKSDSMSDQAKPSLESATPLLEASLLKPSRTELKEKDTKDCVKSQEKSTKYLDLEESLPTREDFREKSEGKEEVQNAVKVMKINKANPLAVKQYPLRDQKESTQSTALVSSDSEEARSERPQRTRRSVEQKDFIYDVKRSNSVKSENEKSDGKKNIVQKQTQECGEDQRSRSRKRSLSSRFELVSKRGRVGEDSPPEPCNGSASQLAILDIEVPIHHTVSLRNGKNDAEPKLTLQGSPLAKRSKSTDNGPTRSTDSRSPESESATSVDSTEMLVNSDIKEESAGEEEHLAEVSSCRTASEKRIIEKRREIEVGVRAKEMPFFKSMEEEAKRAKSKGVSGSEENSKDHPTEATPLSRRDKSGSSAAKGKVLEKCEASSKSLEDKDTSQGSQTPLDIIPLPNNDSIENQMQNKNNSSYSLENGDCEPLEKRAEKKGASMLNDTSHSDADSCHPSPKECEKKCDKKREEETKKQKQKEILDSMRAVYNKPRDDIQD